jgi:hypothetical protein
MSDLSFQPGLSWNQFVSKYARQTGLTYNQSMLEAREMYHRYKAEEATISRQPKIVRNVPMEVYDETPKISKRSQQKQSIKKPKAKMDSEYQQFLEYQAMKQQYKSPRPKKPTTKPKYKMVQVPVSDSDNSDESD